MNGMPPMRVVPGKLRVRVLDTDPRNAGRVGYLMAIRNLTGRLGQAVLLADVRDGRQFWTRAAFTRPIDEGGDT